MTFSPKCKDYQPLLFLVDGFVTGSPEIQTPRFPNAGKASVATENRPAVRSFRQYPALVKEAFSKALNGSLEKIVFKTAQDSPKASAQPLFKVSHVEGIENVQLNLGAGDVVICFAVFPATYGFGRLERSFQNRNPIGGDVERVINALRQKLNSQFTNNWKLLADPKRSPPPALGSEQLKPVPDTLGLAGGLATPLSIVLASGATAKTYFASRVAVIDAGSVTGVAVDSWFPTKGASKKKDAAWETVMRQLSSGAGENDAFTPLAVAKIAEAKLADGKSALLPAEFDQIMSMIGRGLGYTVVHEFWHATRGPKNRGHVPENSGLDMLSVIEGAGNPSFRKEGLTLREQSVKEITEEYEQTWCKFIQEGRGSIASLRK